LRTVTRFGELAVDAGGNCQAVLYDHRKRYILSLKAKGFCTTRIRLIRCG
jgi:hypothetical protein